MRNYIFSLYKSKWQERREPRMFAAKVFINSLETGLNYWQNLTDDFKAGRVIIWIYSPAYLYLIWISDSKYLAKNKESGRKLP